MGCIRGIRAKNLLAQGMMSYQVGALVGQLQKGWTELFGHDFVYQALRHIDKDQIPKGQAVPL